MDTRVPAESVPSDEGAGWSPVRRSDDALDRRLAALEARLDDLDEAIRDAVPVATRNAVEAACRDVVPDACRSAVHEELQGVGEDLRRAVSDLGRLLLRDLDRLTKVLADHRDAIVERLVGLEDEMARSEPAPDPDVEAPIDPAEPPPPAEPPSLSGEDGRWRVVPALRRGRDAARGRGRRKPGRGDAPSR